MDAALELLPFVFLGIPAGVWVDRLRRRPILVLTDVGRGASLLSVPIAYRRRDRRGLLDRPGSCLAAQIAA